MTTKIIILICNSILNEIDIIVISSPFHKMYKEFHIMLYRQQFHTYVFYGRNRLVFKIAYQVP